MFFQTTDSARTTVAPRTRATATKAVGATAAANDGNKEVARPEVVAEVDITPVAPLAADPNGDGRGSATKAVVVRVIISRDRGEVLGPMMGTYLTIRSIRIIYPGANTYIEL